MRYGDAQGCLRAGADAELWARAEQYARARRLTMSALVMTVLEAYLDDQGDDDAR